MKQEIAMMWSERLRSGKYQQATDQLMRRYQGEEDVRHCCLNILNLLAQENGVAIFVDEVDLVVYWDAADAETYTVPPPVMEWAELKTDNGVFSDSNIRFQIQTVTGGADSACTLAACNDSLHLNFDQIADVIDAHWEEL